MRVAALTSGKNVPSARFRVRQYIDALLREGVEVEELYSKIDKYSPPTPFYQKLAFGDWKTASRYMLAAKKRLKKPLVKKADGFDLVWLERTLVESELTFELQIRKPMVFDLDDAIWLGEGKGFADKIAAKADHIFAGNSFLAEWCSHYNKNISIIPTAVDTKKFFPLNKSGEKKLVIGWIGTSSNFRFLQTIFPVLHELLHEFPHLEFHVCADKAPDFQSPKFHFTPWSEQAEVSFLQSLDLGVMPLADDDWSRGKCSLKMLQYMSVGIPAVVSPYGMNAEILQQWNPDLGAKNNNEWKEKLHQLLQDEKWRNENGSSARKLMVEKYDVNSIASSIATQFKKLV